jgi:protein O-GlcNAc transferase
MSQSFYKCLPQHDSIYPCIARNVPDAQFVFISRHGSEITDQFMRRLAKAFARHQLSHRDFCLVLPKLGFQDFLSLNCCSDVLLDTFCWSGGKTTLEAISCGLPVVTYPGAYMRGRHSFGILKMIDMDECIARDETHYVQIASQLGTDEAFYQGVCRKLQRNRNKLYEDPAPVRALEVFYRSVVCSLNSSQSRRARSEEPRPINDPAFWCGEDPALVSPLRGFLDQNETDL